MCAFVHVVNISYHHIGAAGLLVLAQCYHLVDAQLVSHAVSYMPATVGGWQSLRQHSGTPTLLPKGYASAF